MGDLDGADPPLATIDRLTIEVGPGLLRTLLGDAPLILREIAVTRPRIAVVIREDGSTNLPDLPQAEPSEEGGLEIRIGLLDLQEGELRVADRSVPLDFVAAKFRASARQTPRGAFAMEARSQRLRLDLTNGSLEGTLSFAARKQPACQRRLQHRSVFLRSCR